MIRGLRAEAWSSWADDGLRSQVTIISTSTHYTTKFSRHRADRRKSLASIRPFPLCGVTSVYKIQGVAFHKAY